MKDAVQPQSNDEFVFPKSGKGTDVAKNFFQVHVKSKPGFAKKKVHSLRHTFASMVAAIGFPEAIVAKLLGHKQQSMTTRYTHVTEDAVQQAADKITRRIAGLLDIPERCAKPEDVKMFPRGIHLYKLHLVKPGEYPRPIPARKQSVAGCSERGEVPLARAQKFCANLLSHFYKSDGEATLHGRCSR